MKRKMTMFVMALCLFAGSYAYADPPDNKKPHEWQKQQYDMEKERQQKEREFYKDDRKYREEIKKDDYGKRREGMTITTESGMIGKNIVTLQTITGTTSRKIM